MLIILFRRDYPSDSTARIRNISLISWYYMHVDMKYTLACSLSNVNANVIPVRMIFLINNAFDAIRKFKHILLFILREIKE